ncbi:hypothetical protein AAG906_034644 [Vitis piasezkii]
MGFFCFGIWGYFVETAGLVDRDDPCCVAGGSSEALYVRRWRGGRRGLGAGCRNINCNIKTQLRVLRVTKTVPSKWGLDLIDQWQKGMILEVFAKMAMASFVLVIPYIPLPFPCAAHLLSLDGSSRGDIDKLALDPAPTSKPMLYFF